VSVARQLASVAAGVALAACNGDAAPAAALEARVAAIERRLEVADAQQQRLLTTLREHGIAFRAAPPGSAAEATARALEDLDQALGRLESAKVNQDGAMGQGAMTALEAALQTLRQDPGAALPALLARAETAPPVRQAALLECYGRVGNAAAAPALLQLASSPARPPGMRVQAARALIEVDADAAIPAVDALVHEAGALPELYLLVHLLAGTGKPAAVPVLVAALAQSRDRSVRCHAATGLGSFRGDASVAALATAATADEYPAVRTNALRALAKVAAAERLRAVVEQVVADDADAAVRAVARDLLPAAGNR